MTTGNIAKQEKASPAARMAEASTEPSLVGKPVYDALVAFAERMQHRDGACDASASDLDRISRFLHLEARLLDERRYHDWLDCTSEDFVYWVPSGLQTFDPRYEVAVNFDDRRRLLDRVALHETGVQVAQIPPSRTCRSVTNLEAWRTGDGLEVRSNLILWEFRRQQMSVYAGSQQQLLVETVSGIKLRFKVIRLVNPAEPQGNLTFII